MPLLSKRLLTEHEAEAGPDGTDFIGSHLTLSPKQQNTPKITASITFDWRIIKFVVARVVHKKFL